MFYLFFHEKAFSTNFFYFFFVLSAPGPPILIPEECIVENNSITVAWQAHLSSFVEGFILELDDGNAGAFRVSLSILDILFIN